MGSRSVERVLCILPAPEPTEILDKLRASHSDIEIKYIQRQWRNPGVVLEELPKGIKSPCHSSEELISPLLKIFTKM